jgi:oligosaccharyltransferase complex subunit delta (ribophorin II)
MFHIRSVSRRVVKQKLTLYVPHPTLYNNFSNGRQTQKDLPSQFLRSSRPVEASLVFGSFGASQGYNDLMFLLNVATDTNTPMYQTEKPLRYGKLPEIHHIFKSDPKSPNILFSLVFTGAVLATLPAIFGVVSFPIKFPNRQF